MMQQSVAATIRNPESSLGYFGWRVLLGAVVGLALSPGPVALLLVGSLAPKLHAAHGWSLGAIMASLTFLNLASIVAAPIAGKIIDRFGARAVLLPSIVVMAICLLLLGYVANTLPRLYAIGALYGFATIGAQSLTYTKLLTSWFDENRGVVLGIAAAGLGLGYSVLPIFFVFGLALVGPARTTALLAGLLIVLPLVLNAFVAFPAETPAEPAHATSANLTGIALRPAMATAPFWIMAAVVFVIGIIAAGIVPNFASIGHDLHLQRAEAASIASVFGLATLGGRLLVGWLFDRFFAPRVASVMFLLAAVGYALASAVIGFGLTWQVLAAGALLMGLGFGAESDLIGYLASRYFGHRHFAAIYGTLLAIFILGVAIGPLLYGVMRDATGDYRLILAISAVLGACAGLLMLRLPAFPAAAHKPSAEAVRVNPGAPATPGA